MSSCKASLIPVITGFRLSKGNDESSVDPLLFKRMVCSLVHLTTTMPDTMYGVRLISRFMESLKRLSLTSRKENPEVCN